MKANLNIPTTEIGKSYWNESGLYQDTYDKLYETLVPAKGTAENLFGEVVRAASRLSYEYYNNGNINACMMKEIEGDWVECSCCDGNGVCEEDGEEFDCPECGGEGGYYEDSEWETELNPFYGNFINLIREFFKANMPGAQSLMDDIESIILRGYDCSFTAEEERPYVLMMDAVSYIIRSKAYTLDEAMKRSPEIPEWYKKEQKG